MEQMPAKPVSGFPLAQQEILKIYWLRVFPTEETYLQALVIANLLLLPPDPV
jgi:hypothetical protein